MPNPITKNRQSAKIKSLQPVVKSVATGMSNIEKKNLEMERILNKFPTPNRPKNNIIP